MLRSVMRKHFVLRTLKDRSQALVAIPLQLRGLSVRRRRDKGTGVLSSVDGWLCRLAQVGTLGSSSNSFGSPKPLVALTAASHSMAGPSLAFAN